MANTTADKLALAAANKVAIKAAIAAKNPTTAPTNVMSQWSTAIASIPTEEVEETYDGKDTLWYCKFTRKTGKSIAFYDNWSGCIVEWGDGTSDTIGVWDVKSHEYANFGEYVIRIKALPNNDAFECVIHGSGLSAAPYKIKFGSQARNYFSSPDYSLNPDFVFVKNVSPPKVVSDSSLYPNCSTWRYVKMPKTFDVLAEGGSISFTISQNSVIRVKSRSFTGGRWTSFGGCKVVFDFANVSASNYGFNNCGNLLVISGLEHLVIDSGEFMFYGCGKLSRIDFDIVISGGNNNNAFNGCAILMNIPKIQTENSISFAPCTGISDRQSVIDFADNLNVCQNSGQTITFNAVIKTLLGDDFAVVESTLTAKNWSVAW